MTSQNLKICKAVAKVFGITDGQLLSKSRAFAFPRQVAMALCWERSSIWSATVVDRLIGEAFGYDRTTVAHSRNKVNEQRKFGTAQDQNKILLAEEAVRRLAL
jgi:chromosomal replication initiation ATPase DnaA